MSNYKDHVKLMGYGFWFGLGFETAQSITYMIFDWIKIFFNMPLG